MASRYAPPEALVTAGGIAFDLPALSRRLPYTLYMLARDPGRLSCTWCEGDRQSLLGPIRTALLAVGLSAFVPLMFGFATGTDRTSQEIRDNFYTDGLLFTLVICPLVVGLLSLLMIGRGERWSKHWAVGLYELSFIVTLLMLASVGNKLSGQFFLFSIASTLAIAIHGVAHLRGAYALSWPGATFRALALLWVISRLQYAILMGPPLW